MSARALLLAIVSVGLAPTLAHHSGAGGEPIRIEGVVTAVRMVNPHAQLIIEVQAGTGERLEWTLVAAPPAELQYLGWTTATVPVGTRVKILGRPSGLGGRVVDLDSVEFEDGRVLAVSLPLGLQPGFRNP